MTGAPGFPELLFVVEQPGRVVVLRKGRRLSRPFLDISGLVTSGGERGLLSIAFPPDYRQSRRFYVYYTDAQGDIRVDEFKRRSATRAARGSRRAVIEIPHRENSNHNGGQLQFLGNLLYFGTGDGGSGGDPPNNAQNRDSLLGKLLRIDPRPSGGRPYSVPADNPFVGKPGRERDLQLRPAQPLPLLLRHGDGEAAADRDRRRRPEPLRGARLHDGRGGRRRQLRLGRLRGLRPLREENSGTPDPGGTVKPIFAYGHSRGGSCTIIGGYVVRDRRLPSLYKRYVYADLCEGKLRSLVPHLSRASGDRKLGLSVTTPSSFGEDTRGRVYVASLEGPVYRLVPR